jgi:hypothetical protein
MQKYIEKIFVNFPCIKKVEPGKFKLKTHFEKRSAKFLGTKSGI